MAKTRTSKRSMVVVQPPICSDFPAPPGATVQWQGVPATGCKISQDGSKTWPFNPGPPINNVNTAGTITIKSNLPATTVYTFNVECCANETIHSVTIT
jgi:hypothetical protein